MYLIHKYGLIVNKIKLNQIELLILNYVGDVWSLYDVL